VEIANLVHIFHYRKPETEFCCEGLLGLILQQTGRLADAEIFVKTCLFDSLIGNHDRHGRNLGMLVTERALVLLPFMTTPQL
jgi:serine/threonine protein kinase HipA of HipAB toxin-antitoxin module